MDTVCEDKDWRKPLPLTVGSKGKNRGVNTVDIHTMSELSGVTSSLLNEDLTSKDLLTRFKPCLFSISLEQAHSSLGQFSHLQKGTVPSSVFFRRITDHM